MIEKSYIEEITSSYCATEHPEYYIVEVAVHPGNRIVIELGAPTGLSIDACVALSKHIEGKLDRETEDFELEVGSAGLTSAFKVLRQYTDAVGEEVEVLRKGGIKEKGALRAASAEGITLAVLRKVRPEGQKRKIEVEEELSIPMDEILQTKRALKF